MTDAETACLARLTEMDEALALMQAELPDDAIPIGDEARARVRLWRSRLAAGSADLEALSAGLAEISSLIDALTARFLLVPWEGHANAKGRPS